jgi:beta-N-acetylhexosaminidase
MVYFRTCAVIYSVLFLFLSLGRAEEPLFLARPLSLEEKVGQLFIVGINGTQIEEPVRAHLNDLHPGGILLFKRNLKTKSQLRSLTANLRDSQRVFLFIAVDQEGGVVSRIPTRPHFPSAAWVGRRNRPDLTEKLGFHMGEILLSYGINMNLAPVLDVSHDKNGFLRSRTYSDSPEIVGTLGTSFSRGLLHAGVLPTAKHFPGLGSVAGDPHHESVKASVSSSELLIRDLMPFKSFASLSPSAVMLSHAEYPLLDPVPSPATFSSRISTDLLRRSIGFQGLVITDDLLMEGASTKSTLESRLIKALQSGSDMLLFAWSPKSQKRAQLAILKAISQGVFTMDWLNEKVSKILAVKTALQERQKLRNIASDPDLDYKKTILELRSAKVRRR